MTSLLLIVYDSKYYCLNSVFKFLTFNLNEYSNNENIFTKKKAKLMSDLWFYM